MPAGCSTCNGPPTHLAGLGAVDIPRAAYLERLHVAVDLPLPAIWA